MTPLAYKAISNLHSERVHSLKPFIFYQISKVQVLTFEDQTQVKKKKCFYSNPAGILVLVKVQKPLG